MADVRRNIYFYRAIAAGNEWRREDVLNGLKALRGDDRLLNLGDGNYAWACVDLVPHAPDRLGRLRLFRIRRRNLPGVEDGGVVSDLGLPDSAGLAEPSHVVLGPDGLIAAEFNNDAPRISAFQRLINQHLGMNVRIGSLIQGDIVEQLDRLRDIRLLELSVVPTPSLNDELRNAGRFGDAVALLSDPEGGRRVNIRLSADKRSESWTEEARGFIKRLLHMGADEHMTKVMRVTGYDPVAHGVEAVDLLKQRLMRRESVARDNERSRALNKTSAYKAVEAALRDVQETDLANAGLLFPQS